MAKNDLTITVRLRDFASRTLKGITKKFTSFTKRLITFPFKLIANGFKRIAQIGLLAISAALAKLSFDLIKFEAEFKKVVTLLDEDSFKNMNLSLEEGIKFLEKEAINTMARFGLSIEDTNKALFDTISAGVPASEAIGFLNESAKLAIAGVTSLSVATDGMTSIFNVFRDSVKDVNQISRAFFTAQKFGKTTVAELASNIGKVAPIAKAAGISFEELLSATAQLTLGGLKTDEAITSLKGAISGLVKPTKEARKIFTDLEIPFGKAALTGGNLGKTLGILAEKSEGNLDVLSELIPNIRALTAVTALDAAALENLDRIIEAVTNDTESLDRAFEEQFNTFNRQAKVFIGNARKIFINITKDILPKITAAIAKINKLSPEIQTNILKFLARIKTFFVDVKTIATIFAESAKEIIARPFDIETYKTILTEFGRKLGSFFNKIAEASKKLIGATDQELLALFRRETEENKTLEEEIIEIKQKAADRKAEIEAELQAKIQELGATDLEATVALHDAHVQAYKNRVEKEKNIEEEKFDFLSFLNNKQLEQNKKFFNFIVQGARSSNALVASIAKAAALFDIAVKTRQAAMQAMAAFPPPFNFIAAGAAIAFGVEQASAVASLKPGFQAGGIVPGNSRRGDQVDVRANSGEAILTGSQQKRFMDIAEGKTAPGGAPRDLSVVLNVDGTTLAQTVIEGYNTGRNLDIITPISSE